MKKLSPLLVLLAIALLAPTGAEAKAKPTKYYLALGDSLAWGYEQDAAGKVVRSPNSYVNQVYKAARKRTKKLKLVNYGCPGENLKTFVDGGCIGQPLVSTYDTRSQWTKAAAFLKKHRKQTKLITISIGANEFTPCAAGGSIDIACIGLGVQRLEAGLPAVLKKVRHAAGKKVKIVTHDLYNPYLALALRGGSYATLAYGSVEIQKGVNATIRAAAKAAKIATASVTTPFQSEDLTDQTTLAGQQVPVAVAKVCELTQICLPAPQGNIHPNDAGYAVIAKAIEKAARIK
jgi:lysophospholipase L1-like esterase